MKLIYNKYYIIRMGNFATNGNLKILYGAFSLLLSYDDYIKYNSTDCILILSVSTVIWSFIETLLYLTNTRVIKPMHVYLNDYTYTLPKYMSILLQGLQEGGFITTIGLYYGDRLHNTRSIIHLHLLLGLISVNVLTTKRPNPDVISSKRQVNSRGSLIFIGSITIYNTTMLYLYPEHFYRQLRMFFVMTYVSSLWTLCAWYKGFRTIQVQTKNPIYDVNAMVGSESSLQEYFTKRVNIFDTLCILGYDILFEIGVAYLMFYNICL